MRNARVAVGVLVWLGAIAAAGWGLDRKLAEDGGSTRALAGQLGEFAAMSRRSVELTCEDTVELAVGDPVFQVDSRGVVRQIGEVTVVFENKTERSIRRGLCQRAHATLFAADDLVTTDIELTHHSTPDSLDWVLRTMLPAERRRKMAQVIGRAVEENKHEIVRELKPVVERGLRESVRVLEVELAGALRRHRDELAVLGARYQRDLVASEVVPLVREEVLPIVRKHAEPLAEEIGAVLWERMSVWRFAWRYAYDISFLPKRDRVKGEWRRFLEDEVVPELESRSDEIVGVVQRILSDAARNPEIRKAVRRNLSAIIEDPEVHRIVWKVFREIMIDSPRVREVLEKNWNTPEAQKAFRIASDRFEPTAQEIGDMLFGTRETGITPEFAAVLRRQILSKDQRWLIVTAATSPSDAPDGAIRVRRGAADTEMPRPESNETAP